MDIEPRAMSAVEGMTEINIGTRRSQLAIAQVDMIIQQLEMAMPGLKYRAHVVSTMADENQVKSFDSFNSKSIWTEELEQLLIDRKLDVVVHCLKDMPTQLPEACQLGIICEREDPRDVVVMQTNSPCSVIKDLPVGSIVGTSSVRRKAHILRHYPHLKCEDIRGNINTRLRKLDADDSPYACLVLAAAGLKRIDLGHRITQYLDASDGMLYAPGQGALGLEIRTGDERMLGLLSTLSHESTRLACLAEKHLLRVLEGGCSAPIGVETKWDGDELTMASTVISVDGKRKVESSMQRMVKDTNQAEAFGKELAERLLDLGADEILKEIRSATGT